MNLSLAPQVKQMGSWRREKASAGPFRGSIMEEVVSLHLKQLVEVRKEHFFQRSGGGGEGFSL